MEICNTVTCKIMKRNNFANLILTPFHQNIYTVSYVCFLEINLICWEINIPIQTSSENWSDKIIVAKEVLTSE